MHVKYCKVTMQVLFQGSKLTVARLPGASEGSIRAGTYCTVLARRASSEFGKIYHGQYIYYTQTSLALTKISFKIFKIYKFQANFKKENNFCLKFPVYSSQAYTRGTLTKKIDSTSRVIESVWSKLTTRNTATTYNFNLFWFVKCFKRF